MSSWKSKNLLGNIFSLFQGDTKETISWGNDNQDKATSNAGRDSTPWQHLGRRKKACLRENCSGEEATDAEALSLKSESMSNLREEDFENFFGTSPICFRQNSDVGSFVSCRDGSGLPKCLGRRLSDHHNESFQINVKEIVNATAVDNRLKEVLDKLKD
mmetsp:Transcript_19623/g.44884  ORF Transcript_19623/g.44884 Transcript_19623/m.44884 type:complete len:159 (-) Transcript_19623:688-1164(-)|eukprot:746779-Hanusia_phi.AAC.1